MKSQIRLDIFVVFSIAITFLNCTTGTIKQEVIHGRIVTEDFAHNSKGYINSPFGKVHIVTHGFYENLKLTKVLYNKPEGFLTYSIADIRQDTLLLSYFMIDTLYVKELNSLEEIVRNDTLFYKTENNKVTIEIEK